MQNYGLRLRHLGCQVKRVVRKFIVVASGQKKRDVLGCPCVYSRCLNNHLAPGYFNMFFRTNADIDNNRSRGCNKINLPRIRTEFLFQGGMQWNSLNAEMTSASDLQAVKKLFLSHCKK